jgi:beta-glucosidase
VNDLPGLADYSIRPSATTLGRTYMYYRGPISYPFGYGLTYTHFAVSHERIDRSHLDANGTFHVSVNVANKGALAGSDLVQLYVTTPGAPASLERPIKRLESFQQVTLQPGEARTVRFALRVPNLAFFDQSRNRYVVDDGRYGVQIASSARQVLLQRFVDVSGSLTPLPSTLSAEPAIRGDAARGVQTRAMFPERATVVPQLTVSMNDESLYGYISRGQGRPFPAGMRFYYSSDRPGVVAVGPGDTIRTLRNGVATVTATATYRGVSRSTQFVVRVVSELSRLTVGGQLVPGFHPDTYSYDVIVPDGSPAPEVGARTADPFASVQITQASSVPGTATVTETGSDGIHQTYTVYFAHPASSDEFNGTSVGPQWSWIRQNPANEQVNGGSLVITPEQGDLVGTTNTARNILIQPALGNWTIESKLTFSSPPSVASQQGGIIAYQDDDNLLKVDWEYSGGAAQLVETTEDSLSGTLVTQVLASIPTSGLLDGDTVWLRMVKQGPRYTTYYSTDGVHYTPIYEVGAALRDVKVGLFAWNGPATSSNLNVAFDYFHVSNH